MRSKLLCFRCKSGDDVRSDGKLQLFPLRKEREKKKKKRKGKWEKKKKGGGGKTREHASKTDDAWVEKLNIGSRSSKKKKRVRITKKVQVSEIYTTLQYLFAIGLKITPWGAKTRGKTELLGKKERV